MYGLGYSLEWRVKNISNFVGATMTGYGVEILGVGVKIRDYIFALMSVHRHLQAKAGMLGPISVGCGSCTLLGFPCVDPGVLRSRACESSSFLPYCRW